MSGVLLPSPSSMPLVTDTMTLKSSYPGAPVFDVDSQTGFMAPSEPVRRLPTQWEPWESILDAAIHAQLQLGDKPGLTKEEEVQSEQWRASVRQVRLLVLSSFSQSIDTKSTCSCRFLI
jgi:Indoleamine 2,3-dioxygenase